MNMNHLVLSPSALTALAAAAPLIITLIHSPVLSPDHLNFRHDHYHHPLRLRHTGNLLLGHNLLYTSLSRLPSWFIFIPALHHINLST